MYKPPQFEMNDESQVWSLIQENPFATLISYPTTGGVFINHLPMIRETRDGEKVLIGHMAKGNPQWRHFKENNEALLIFHGPHAYVSPKWYRSGREVPTWNYAVVHLSGKIELLEAHKDQMEILRKLSLHFESAKPEPWDFDLPDDLKFEGSLESVIISFRFHIEKCEAKFKLSQNRNSEDRLGVISGLSSQADENSQKISRLMKEMNQS